MFKNTAGQKWAVFAFDRTDNTPKTGDAGNITANVRIDGGGANGVDDTNPTELEDGFYIFDISKAESNGDNLVIAPASVTANIQVIGVPAAIYTRPPVDDFVLAILKRDWTGITGEAARSMLNALRFLRNKWSISGSTLTVTKENDSDAAWTSQVSGDAGADPIVGSDPA